MEECSPRETRSKRSMPIKAAFNAQGLGVHCVTLFSTFFVTQVDYVTCFELRQKLYMITSLSVIPCGLQLQADHSSAFCWLKEHQTLSGITSQLVLFCPPHYTGSREVKQLLLGAVNMLFDYQTLRVG